MTKITATGESTRKYRAERATVHIGVVGASTSRHEAIGLNAERHNEALRIGRDLDAAGRATFVKGLPTQTYSRTVEREGVNIVEFVTSSNVLVRLSDLDYLSEFLNDLQKRGYTTYVTWALTKGTLDNATSTVRRRAVEKARVAAEDYARALDARISGVDSISDANGDSRRFGAMRGSAGGTAQIAEVSVPEIEVSASIVGVFEASEHDTSF